jgi:cytoskeletal protein CcmA (bactofilin family)
MFGKQQRKDPSNIKTLVAQGTRIHGDVEFEDGLRVDGEVHGSIRAGVAGSMLVISEGAVVEGGVRADHVIINGTVKGPIEASDVLELQAKATVEGDIQYAALEMQHGAVIKGQLRPMATEDDARGKKVIQLAATGG